MTDLPDDIVQGLERAAAVADAAVAILDRYPGEYRAEILAFLLAAADRRGSPARGLSAAPRSGSETDDVPEVKGEDESNALGAVAAAANVDQVDLERVFVLDDDGFAKLLLRIDGRSMADRANRAAAIYCFLKEHGFGQRDIGIEELRRLCIEQQAYNAPNFARNLKKCPWLLVIDEPGSRDKKYRLSAQGEEVAKLILQELLGV